MILDLSKKGGKVGTMHSIRTRRNVHTKNNHVHQTKQAMQAVTAVLVFTDLREKIARIIGRKIARM